MGDERPLALRYCFYKTAAQQAAVAALAEPLHVLHSFYMDKKAFIGGDHPSIADIRLAATLEFLHVIDYHFPVWATNYVASACISRMIVPEASPEASRNWTRNPRSHPPVINGVGRSDVCDTHVSFRYRAQRRLW